MRGDFDESVAAIRSGLCPDCGNETTEFGKCDRIGHYQMGRICIHCMTWIWFDGQKITTEPLRAVIPA